jgi:GNAT superfamily N-acetyltransferase
MFMAVYKLTGYPKQLQVSGGPAISVRPMTRDDANVLVEFFKRVPDDERYFLKDDVVSEGVIEGWAKHLDYDRALPLLAFDGDRICADGVLIRHRGDARSHYAEIRVVVDADYRARGVGTALMRELIDIAWDAELESVQGEFVRDIQDDALKVVQAFGGVEAGVLKDAVRDHQDHPHDLVFMRIPLGRSWQWSRY